MHRSAYGWVPIPVAYIKNGEGPRVLLMAGNHGDEYEGQVALGKLIRSLAAEEVRGRIIILPSANFVIRHGIRALTLFRCSWRLRWGEKASAEQVELGAAVHLPFDELELGDLAFSLAIGPGLGHGSSDGAAIGNDALAEGRQDTIRSIGDL